MPHANETPLPKFGSALFGSSLQSSGPWNSNSTGAFGASKSRDVVTPRGEFGRDGVSYERKGRRLTYLLHRCHHLGPRLSSHIQQ